MKILLRQAKLHGKLPQSLGKARANSAPLDFLLEDGVLTKAGLGLKVRGALEVKSQNLHVSRGFTDLYAHFGTPGYENRETLESGTSAALAGGFTRVLLQPDTSPILQSGGEIISIKAASTGLPVEIALAAALTEDLRGHELTDMMDLKAHGASAFSNANASIESAQSMLRILQYGAMTGLPLMCVPYDQGLSLGGQMHESSWSLQWGLRGIPAVAETMRLDRDLALVAYLVQQGVRRLPRLHWSKISSAGSVERIRAAMQSGWPVSCGVAAHHLLSTVEDLSGFRSEFKVFPPLRSEEDRTALVHGILDGTITAICSDHQPGDFESKDHEFPQAEFGQAGIQYAFVAALEAGQSLPARTRSQWVSRVVSAFTEGPEQVLGLGQSVDQDWQQGKAHGWVLFDPTLNSQSNRRVGSGNSAAFETISPTSYSKGVAQAYRERSFEAKILAVAGRDGSWFSSTIKELS
jgi:dihydroorotase